MIAILITKLIIKAIQLANLGSGTNLPGRIARKISPNLLSMLVKQTRREIIIITGTNGKTTTAGLLASILRQDGRKTIHNHRGANMLPGITTEVVSFASLTGRLDADNCIFEVDEAFLERLVDECSPDIIAVTNLFRDQLDRYGELDTTAKKIRAGIIKSHSKKPLKLILNADDPTVSGIMGKSNIEEMFFGFEEEISVPRENFTSLSPATRPEPQIKAKTQLYTDYSVIYIDNLEIKINLPGLYNCCNALCAAAIAWTMEISPENIKKGIENYSTVFGRAETLEIDGKKAVIQLIKNPIGATEVLNTIKNDSNGRLLIIINDNYADGRDVSWLWDADFELLTGHDKTAIVSGIRAEDMAIRLKYAGLSPDKIIVEKSIKKAFLKAINDLATDEKLYVLPTYTSLLELDRFKRSSAGRLLKT